jgi:hypothetical protein
VCGPSYEVLPIRSYGRRPTQLGSRSLLGIALWLGACGDPAPPPAPFGAENVLGGRDPGLELEGFNASRTRLFYSRTIAEYDSWSFGLGNRLFDLWAVDLAGGQSELVAEKVRWFFGFPWVGSGELLGLVRQDSVEEIAPPILTVLDSQGGTRQDYDHVVPASIAWSERWIVFMRDPFFRELWAGPWAAPQKISGTLLAHDWAWFTSDQLALAASRSAAVLASGSLPITGDGTFPAMSSREDPATRPGIFRVDLGSGSITEEVPAQIETATWSGSDPAPLLSSSGLYSDDSSSCCSVAMLSGSCWSRTEPKAWGAHDQQCFLLYRRLLTDGTTRVFVYDAETREEIALGATQVFRQQFDLPGGSTRNLPWFSGNGPLAAFFGVSGTAYGLTALFVWDAERKRERICPVQSRSSPSWRSDGRALGYANGVQAFVVDQDTWDCEVLGAGDAHSVAFSPDGSRLIWRSDTGLWQAEAHGQEARLVLNDDSLGGFGFVDSHRILAQRLSEDGLGLAWIDLDDPAPTEHPVVEQVFGRQYQLGARFRALGTQYNAQDQTGEVTLIDLDQFTLTTLAEAAADYVLGWPPAVDAPWFPFAYLKMGRFPSAQDGIWVGWIPRERIQGS